MSTELVPVETVDAEVVTAGENGSALADIDKLEALIPAAIEEGASEWLHELARRAEGARLYEARRGAGKLVNRCMRLKVQAEAGLGLIDIREHPRSVKHHVLVLCGEEIGYGTRQRWRRFGVALERGVLGEVLDKCEADGELNTTTMNIACNCVGVNYVPRAFVLERLTAFTRERSTSIRAFCNEIGITSPPHMHPKKQMSWHLAVQLMRAMGQDPATLPLGRRSPRGGTTRQNVNRPWLVRERKPTGGAWDEVSVRFYALRTQIASLMPNAEPRWDKAYEHLYWLQDFIHEQMKREAIRK